MTELEMQELQAANIRRALDQADGKIYGRTGAAALLGIKATTLASRIRALKIER